MTKIYIVVEGCYADGGQANLAVFNSENTAKSFAFERHLRHPSRMIYIEVHELNLPTIVEQVIELYNCD